jgi:hypothetical protein
MHHASAAVATPALFEGYGWHPSWLTRHAAMIEKCVELEDLCRRRGHKDAAQMWPSRTQTTHAWRE